MSSPDSRDSGESNCRNDSELFSNNEDYAEILVIRHGQTDWSAEGKIQGQSNVELNAIGRQQSIELADRLSKEHKISAIYSSDIKRAVETAELIANVCGLEVIKDPNLRERNVGVLQGVSYSEAATLHPHAYAAYRSFKMDQEMPDGAENRGCLSQRSITCLQDIGIKHKGERVVVVTHGTVIAVLYGRANQKLAPVVPHASVNTLHLFDGDKWIMKSWGDASHLKGGKENR